MLTLRKLIVIIKGGGDVGSGVAYRLFKSGFNVLITEISQPVALRRTVSFCEAVYTEEAIIEGVKGRLVRDIAQVRKSFENHDFIPIIVDPDCNIRKEFPFYKKNEKLIIVDARMTKHKNPDTNLNDANLVIGLGPGFVAPIDVHVVVETAFCEALGQVIYYGSALPDTGTPPPIEGYTVERVVRAPATGIFKASSFIGQEVSAGEIIGSINNTPVIVRISGLLRGLIREGLYVTQGMKIGEIDPRGKVVKADLNVIPYRSRAIAGGVLEAILNFFSNSKQHN